MPAKPAADSGSANREHETYSDMEQWPQDERSLGGAGTRPSGENQGQGDKSLRQKEHAKQTHSYEYPVVLVHGA
jgi:hypothetical protein